MTKKILFPLLALTLVSSAFTPVEARQPRQTSQTRTQKTEPVRSKWSLFTGPDGRFSILMPGNPKRVSQTQKTFMGEINLEMFVGKPENQDVAYVVAFNDFPDSYGKMVDTQEILSNARDMALKTTKSNLIGQKDIRSTNGHPGKEIEYINQAGKITRNRMFFAEGRLYQVMVITTKRQQQFLTQSIQGYLNSFNVVLRSNTN